MTVRAPAATWVRTLRQAHSRPRFYSTPARPELLAVYPSADAPGSLQQQVGRSKSVTQQRVIPQRPEYLRLFEPAMLPPSARDGSSKLPHMEATRVVPQLNTYFTLNPAHAAIMDGLERIAQRHVLIPRDETKTVQGEGFRWVNIDEYRPIAGGTRLRPIQHRQFVRLCNRLFQMDDQLIPDEVERALAPYKRAIAHTSNSKGLRSLDEDGRAVVVGKRKTAGAKVQMARGAGEVLVNGKLMAEFAPRLLDRLRLLYPFQVVGQENQFNVFAQVTGGGRSLQVGAVVHGIARALVVHNPLFTQRLMKAGVLGRDPRRRERKKPGKLGARKSPTWVKR